MLGEATKPSSVKYSTATSEHWEAPFPDSLTCLTGTASTLSDVNGALTVSGTTGPVIWNSGVISVEDFKDLTLSMLLQEEGTFEANDSIQISVYEDDQPKRIITSLIGNQFEQLPINAPLNATDSVQIEIAIHNPVNPSVPGELITVDNVTLSGISSLGQPSEYYDVMGADPVIQMLRDNWSSWYWNAAAGISAYCSDPNAQTSRL